MSKISYTAAFLLLMFVFSCGQDKHAAPTSEPHSQSSQTSPPADPLRELIEGNRRFLDGKPQHPDQTIEHLHSLAKEQHPFAVVVSCSDSRVPPSLVFDQGLGDLFVVRNAGNIVANFELGSIEYAVEHLGTQLIVVLGHERCGAISAFAHHGSKRHNDHIENILDYIGEEEEIHALPMHLQHNVDVLVKANILHGVHVIKKSEPILKPLIDAGKVKVIGAMYDIDDGKIEIIEDDNTLFMKK